MLTLAWFSRILRVSVYSWSSSGCGSVQRIRGRQDRFFFFLTFCICTELFFFFLKFLTSIFENSLQLIGKTGLNSAGSTCVS